jgi:hypothetical protein
VEDASASAVDKRIDQCAEAVGLDGGRASGWLGERPNERANEKSGKSYIGCCLLCLQREKLGSRKLERKKRRRKSESREEE